MTTPRVRVLVVDDDDLMRAGLRAVLSTDPKIDLVAEARGGWSAIDQARLRHPDVILMDVRMADLDGIATTEAIIAAQPSTKVVLLTTFEQDDYIFGGLRAGASGFLLKRARPEELIAAIHTVASGDGMLSPSVTRRVIAHVARRTTGSGTTRAEHIEPLTRREHEVLAHIARGQSNAEIAADLFIEESTVKTHVKRILQKLGVRDRVQAVIVAHETGLTA